MDNLTRQFLNKCHANKVIVHCVGDAMIDEYYEVKVNRISPEHPVPVMLCQNKIIKKPGGVANVAYQFINTFAEVKLITFYDNDAMKIFYQNGLYPFYSGVEAKLPIKRRFVENGIQVAPRLDIEHVNCNLSKEYIDEYFQLIKNFIDKHQDPDVVILSDYNKGFFNSDFNYVSLYPNSITIVDPKSKDLNKWKNCTIFKPNRKEAEELSGLFDWKEQCLFFVNLLNCKAVIITDAGNGIKGFYSGIFFEYAPDYCSDNVQSVIGAGDCFAAFLALASAQGFNPVDSAKIAYHAGLVYVKQKCNRPIVLAELASDKFVKPQDLIKRDFKLAFTNGCFDILHSGHLHMLKFAKTKGDKLVVALNSDKSIKRLKGNSRPINSLEERIKILSSVEYVDFIVCFDEDTPLELIKILKPDALIKGGDYNGNDIIGSDIVDEVYFSDYITDKSTTATINKLKGN